MAGPSQPVQPRDLWPDDITVNALTPAMILNEQAEILARKTRGLLQPELLREVANVWVRLSFDIVVPAFNNFRQRILTTLNTDEECYPVAVIAKVIADYSGGIPSPFSNTKFFPLTLDEKGMARIPRSPDEFQELLTFVFRSDSIRGTIHSVIARANEAHHSLSRLRVLETELAQQRLAAEKDLQKEAIEAEEAAAFGTHAIEPSDPLKEHNE